MDNDHANHANYINAIDLKIVGIYKAYVFDCYDGDTFTVSINFHGLYFKIKIRLLHCDAYELKIPYHLNGHNVTNRAELKEKGLKEKDQHQFYIIDDE